MKLYFGLIYKILIEDIHKLHNLKTEVNFSVSQKLLNSEAMTIGLTYNKTTRGTTESNSYLALVLLEYLLPVSCTMPDVDRIILFHYVSMLSK